MGIRDTQIPDIAETIVRLEKEESRTLRREMLLQAVIDTFPHGVIVCSNSGKFLLWNRRARETSTIEPCDVPMSEWPEHFGIYSVENRDVHMLPSELPIVKALNGEKVRDARTYVKGSGVFLVDAEPLHINGDQIGAIAFSTLDVPDG